MSYDELKEKIAASIRKEQGRAKAILVKKMEKRAIKKAGGGHAIARKLMSRENVSTCTWCGKIHFGGPENCTETKNDSATDFTFGHNDKRETREDIDRRIEEQAAARCMEKIFCPRCNHFHGYCVEIKEKIMLPTGDNNSSNNRSRTGGLNFINTQDLSTAKQEAKILMVKYTEKGGKTGQPSITLKLAFKGDIRYLWLPCRKTDYRYATLLNAFSSDENNWVDERILLYLEKNDFTENYETKIDIATSSAKKGK